MFWNFQGSNLVCVAAHFGRYTCIDMLDRRRSFKPAVCRGETFDGDLFVLIAFMLLAEIGCIHLDDNHKPAGPYLQSTCILPRTRSPLAPNS